MKKLFAYLMAFLMSLKTSTSFNIVNNKPYDNNVYKIEVGDPPDYRSIYGTVNGDKIIRRCNTNKYAGKGKRYGANTNGYWFVNSQDAPKDMADIEFKRKKDGSLTLKKLFRNQTSIIAPFECTLRTKSVGNDCSNMELSCVVKGVTYRITVNNMYCWYCDVSRDEDEYDHHTGDEQYGTKFRGGQVVGKATENTTINIRARVNKRKLKSATSIAYMNTLDQFYYGKYGESADDEDLKISKK